MSKNIIMNFPLILFILIIFFNKSLATNKKNKVDEIVFLDIYNENQAIGDAIIIHSKGQYAMIDVGLRKQDGDKNSSFQAIEKYINTNKIFKLNWVLLTHNHGDHVGAIKNLLDIIKVDKIYTKKYHAYDVACHKNNTELELLNTWKNKVNYIKKKIGKQNLHFITAKNNTKLTLGNYKFKLFNTGQAFTKYKDYCTTNCCNENVNSIVAIARNGNKYYYFGGDIQLYPLPKNSTHPFYNELKAARDKYPLEHWVERAKKYYKDTGYSMDHFHVFKANHHGITADRVNNSKELFLKARPDICVVTTYRARKPLKNIINKANKEGKFSTEIIFIANNTLVINNDKDLNKNNNKYNENNTKKANTKKANTKKNNTIKDNNTKKNKKHSKKINYLKINY